MSRPPYASPAATALFLLLLVGGAAAVGWYAARASHGSDDGGEGIAATLSVATALAGDGGGSGYARADAVRPFQFPADLLFVGRAIALLVAMATALDPDFDPWAAIQPFAQQMATGTAQRDWRGLLDEVEKMTRVILSLPGQADGFFRRASQGELTVRTSWPPDALRTMRRVETAVNRLTSAVVFAALLLAAVAVYLTQGAGPVSYVLFALAAVALLATLIRKRPG